MTHSFHRARCSALDPFRRNETVRGIRVNPGIADAGYGRSLCAFWRSSKCASFSVMRSRSRRKW